MILLLKILYYIVIWIIAPIITFIKLKYNLYKGIIKKLICTKILYIFYSQYFWFIIINNRNL